MKNLIKIAFSVITLAGLTSCMAYSDPYVNGYGNPSYDNGYYYAPQGYYGNGGYWGNDGYYYRNDVNYYYDNGVPYYYQNYNNSRQKVYVERRSGGSGVVTSQRPANGFRYNTNEAPVNTRNNGNNGSFRSGNRQSGSQRQNGGFRNQQQPQQQTQRPQNNNGGFRNNSSQNSGGFRNNSSGTVNSNSGGFRNSSGTSTQPAPAQQPASGRSNGGFR